MQIQMKDGYIISDNCSLQYLLEKIHSLKHFDHHEVIIKQYMDTNKLGLQAYKYGFGGELIISGFTEDEMDIIISKADAYTEIENMMQNIIFDCRKEKIEIPF